MQGYRLLVNCHSLQSSPQISIRVKAEVVSLHLPSIFTLGLALPTNTHTTTTTRTTACGAQTQLCTQAALLMGDTTLSSVLKLIQVSLSHQQNSFTFYLFIRTAAATISCSLSSLGDCSLSRASQARCLGPIALQLGCLTQLLQLNYLLLCQAACWRPYQRPHQPQRPRAVDHSYA